LRLRDDPAPYRVPLKFDFLAHATFAGSYADAAASARALYERELTEAQRRYWNDKSSVTTTGAYQLDGDWADLVPPTDVEWLWPEFLPLGMLTLFSGEQGLSKSFLTIDLVARLTRGGVWPDGTANHLGAGSAIMLLGEDDRAWAGAPFRPIRQSTQRVSPNSTLLHVQDPGVQLAERSN